jgi:hypothetical protein
MLRVLVVLSSAAMLAAEDGRGAPNVLMAIFGISLLVIGPLFGGIVFGLLQLALYRLLAKLNIMKLENIPMFPVFLLRGMIIMIAIVVGFALWLKVSGNALPGWTQ